MPRFLAAACWLCAVLLPVSAGALGLGEIDLKSALNEPFVADIPLQLDDPADLNSVNVYLASVATFERYGVSRAAYLSDFRFFLSTDDSGNGIVQVRSVRAVSEPFVTLLLEVEWLRPHAQDQQGRRPRPLGRRAKRHDRLWQLSARPGHRLFDETRRNAERPPAVAL